MSPREAPLALSCDMRVETDTGPVSPPLAEGQEEPASDNQKQKQQQQQQQQRGSFKLPTVRDANQVAPTEAAEGQRRRAPHRKASVFSHDGFKAIDELDQSALRHHSLLSRSAGELARRDSAPEAGERAADATLQAGGAGASSQPAPVKTPDELASAGANSMRPRSDALGSTGSSRASSCDEPTIVSPLMGAGQKGCAKLAPGSPQASAASLTSSPSSSLDSVSTDEPAAGAPATQAKSAAGEEERQAGAPASEEAAEAMEVDSVLSLGASSPKGQSADKMIDSTTTTMADCEEQEQGQEQAGQKSAEVAPALSQDSGLGFEPIRSKLKRNSVPDAKTILQHIDRLISRNEEIIENWNQVSIRTYNSATTAAAAASPNSISNPLASPKGARASLAPEEAAGGKRRPSKQRWSTTALSGQVRAECSAASLEGASRVAAERLRRRSCNSNNNNNSNNHGASSKQIPLRQSSDTSAISSSLMGRPLAAHAQQNSLSPRANLLEPGEPAQASAALGAFVANRFAAHQSNENLSFKRQEERQQLNQNHYPQQQQQSQQQYHLMQLIDGSTELPEQLLMAGLLAERQRQQQLFESHLCQQQQQQQQELHEGTLPGLLNYYHLQQQQQQALEHQANLCREQELHQQQQQQLQQQESSARLLAAASLQRQQAEQLMAGGLKERQARESQMLNEFLAKMILDRREPQEQRPAPIVRHSESMEQGGPSEMFTQPLDSATPAHRCEACDIAFWTRDLLNYHLMTSCSARTGPEPERPLAFSFNQPNGFDQLLSPATRQQQQQQQQQQQTLEPAELGHNQQPSDLRLGGGPPAWSLARAHEEALQGLDMTNHHSRQPPPSQLEANGTLEPRPAHAQPNPQSKSASPPRRRTYNEMGAPDQELLRIPARYQAQQQQQQQQPFTGSTLDGLRRQPATAAVREKQSLVAPRSPHKSRESAEQAWKQQLDELVILKQQLLTTASQPMSAVTSTTTTKPTGELQGCNLPIKKRKISEPNMRY